MIALSVKALKLFALIVIAFLVIGIAAVMAHGRAPLWEHNGSIVTIEQTPPNIVTIRYVDPSPALYGLVVPGTILFEGVVRGRASNGADILEGTAYVFSSLCGPIAYPVHGWGVHRNAIRLEGAAPIIDDRCCIIAVDPYNFNSLMLFRFVEYARE